MVVRSFIPWAREMNALLLGMILGSVQVNGLETKITKLDYVGRPIDEVVKSLAVASGVTLVSGRELGREPVILHLQEKTVRQVMDELAYVSDGVWVEKNGAWTLTEKPEQLGVSSELIARIDKAIRDRKEVVWGNDSAKEYVKKVNEGRERMKNSVRVPEGEQMFLHTEGNGMEEMGGQILTSALRQLGGGNLANVAVGQRRIWSTVPNRRQLAFPGNLSAAIQQYRQVVYDVAREAQSNPPSDFGFGWSGDFGVPSSGDMNIAKVNIMAYRSDGAITVGVQLIGRNGEEILMVSDQLSVLPAEDANVVEASGDVIPLSKESQQLIAVNESQQSGRGMTMVMQNGDELVRLETGRVARSVLLEPGLQEILNKPAQVDFLKLFVGESLPVVYGEEEIVALVPDTLWTELYRASRVGDLRESEARAAFSKWTESSMNAGVRRVRPKDQGAARRTRIRRDDLGDLIAKTNANGYAKLQDGATYVRLRGRTLGEQHADAILLTAGQPFIAELLTSDLGYRYQNSVLLSLAPDLMTVLPGTDLKWEYVRMNSGMKAAVESLLFNQPIGTTLGGQATGISVNTEPLPPGMAADREATEKFPNGIPADYSITYSIKEEAGVLGRLQGQRTGRMLTAMDFGAVSGFIEGQGGNQGEYPITQFEEFLDATVRAMEVRLPGNSIHFTDGRLVPGARPKSAAQLDKSFLERGQFAREALRRAGENMGNRGNQAPPPRS